MPNTKKVKAKELSNLKMVSGNEKKFTKVIDEGTLKEWVAIGWIPVGKATKEDYLKYPEIDWR